MLTLTALFDDGMQAKLKQLAGLMRAAVASPVTVIRRVAVEQPKQVVLASARTKPVVYNEWD